jgi:hypothetical protein
MAAPTEPIGIIDTGPIRRRKSFLFVVVMRPRQQRRNIVVAKDALVVVGRQIRNKIKMCLSRFRYSHDASLSQVGAGEHHWLTTPYGPQRALLLDERISADRPNVLIHVNALDHQDVRHVRYVSAHYGGSPHDTGLTAVDPLRTYAAWRGLPDMPGGWRSVRGSKLIALLPVFPRFAVGFGRQGVTRSMRDARIDRI